MADEKPSLPKRNLIGPLPPGVGGRSDLTADQIVPPPHVLPPPVGFFPPAQVASPPGFRAFHGSPYSFNKFDSSKIGTGEGSQSFGHGLYFAGNENVARSYTPPERGPGHIYEVNINADPSRFIDWDQPFGRQSPVVLEAFQRAGIDRPGGPWARHPLGETAYTDLARMLGGTRPVTVGSKTWTVPFSDEVAASAALRDQGVAGIKYLDASSRAQGAGTSNYVVFPGNESLIDIIRRYGVSPGAPQQPINPGLF